MRFARVLFVLLITMGAPWPLAAQSGTIEFVARGAPAIGSAEPIRRQTFYLLRKSYAAIHQEAAALEPGPDLEKFVDSLSLSPELRAWMKRTHRVELSGLDFVRMLSPEDIIGVPEFRQAYRARNVADVPLGFPEPKYSERDKTRNPKKYERQEKEFLSKLRHYLDTHQQSVEGIDIYLVAVNRGNDWARLEKEWQERVERRLRQLTETRYLAARVETDLDGNAKIAGVAPGRYWLSNLNNYAQVGDARLAWDVALDVLAGRLTLLELSNANALPPVRR